MTQRIAEIWFELAEEKLKKCNAIDAKGKAEAILRAIVEYCLVVKCATGPYKGKRWALGCRG